MANVSSPINFSVKWNATTSLAIETANCSIIFIFNSYSCKSVIKDSRPEMKTLNKP